MDENQKYTYEDMAIYSATRIACLRVESSISVSGTSFSYGDRVESRGRQSPERDMSLMDAPRCG